MRIFSGWRKADGGWPKKAEAPRPSAIGHRPSEEGFTLAALVVLLTIISIVVAYTVPEQWSIVMGRERDRQTIFLMKQYARAILVWQTKHGAAPTSLDQLAEARRPRVLRGNGKWPCPLTGKEDDWILVPIQAIDQAGNPTPTPTPPPTPPPDGRNPPPTQGQPSKLRPDASPKDYVGPFVGVRPNAKGPSYVHFKGVEDYSEWVYTVQDLQNEIQMRQAALVAK